MCDSCFNLNSISCFFQIPASLQYTGYMEQFYDTPRNLAFVPPGTSCGTSFLNIDGTTSFFQYDESRDLCESQISPLPLDFLNSSYIFISDIGQDINVSYVYTEPLYNVISHTSAQKSEFLFNISILLESNFRCVDFPSLLTAGEIVIKKKSTPIEKCSKNLNVWYTFDYELKYEDLIIFNTTHHIYKHEFNLGTGIHNQDVIFIELTKEYKQPLHRDTHALLNTLLIVFIPILCVAIYYFIINVL